MVLPEEQITKLYRIRKTVMQMLRDRGYVVEDVEINESKDEFKKKYGEDMKRTDLDFYKAKKDNPEPEDKIYVFFPEEAKVAVKTINAYIKQMSSEKAVRAILVVQQNLTSFSKICVTNTAFHFEVFKDDELLFNVKDHDLVPKHQVLTDTEKKALLERYTLIPTLLPRIQETDPVARYYGLEPGQVVKITRQSEIAGRFVTYRIVV